MTKCCTDHISINTSSKKAPKIDPRNKLRGKLKCRMRCLIGGGKFCYPTSLVAARNPPNKGIHPMILNLKKTHTLTMLGTAHFAYIILHRRMTVHDCLGYNRTLRGWVPILFLGAHRGFHLLGQF